MTQVTIENILKKEGPQRSSRLVEKLILKNGLTKAAAVKQVSRARKPVKKIKGLLPKTEVFLCLDGQYERKNYYNLLYTSFLETRSVYGIVLSAIISRGGVIDSNEFLTISGCPNALKKQVTASKVREKLLYYGFLQEREEPLLGKVLEVNPLLIKKIDKPLCIKARIVVEELLLLELKTWVENNNLAAYKKTMVRGVDIDRMVGQFSWDLTAPSYMRPIFEWHKDVKKKIPGFLVCDVLLKENLKERDILYFHKKILMYERSSNSGKLFPIFIADNFNKKAFNLCRSMGILTTTPGNLLGHVFAKELRGVRDLLKDLPDETDQVSLGRFLKAISKYYESFSNLKGFTFELIVIYVLRLETRAEVSHSKKISVKIDNKIKRAEIDVISCIDDRSVRFIECKSKENGKFVSDDDFLEWVERIETIQEWLKLPDQQEKYATLEIIFEIWTNSDLTLKSKRLLHEINGKSDNKILDKNGSEILSLVRKYECNKGVIDNLRQFFLKKQSDHRRVS